MSNIKFQKVNKNHKKLYMCDVYTYLCMCVINCMLVIRYSPSLSLTIVQCKKFVFCRTSYVLFALIL